MVAVSENLKQFIEEKVGVPSERIKVLTMAWIRRLPAPRLMSIHAEES